MRRLKEETKGIVATKPAFPATPKLSREQKRSVVELITDRIIIHKDEVEIHMHYLPFSKKAAA